MTPRAASRGLAAVAAAALAGNAAVHLLLAAPFDGNRGALVGQGTLFRIQAVADLLAAAAVLVLPLLMTSALAAVVALSGAGVLAVTTFVPLDGTAVGFPYLFEPAWYPLKVGALLLQLVAGAAAGLLALRSLPRLRTA
jgi:hypothetical protein